MVNSVSSGSRQSWHNGLTFQRVGDQARGLVHGGLGMRRSRCLHLVRGAILAVVSSATGHAIAGNLDPPGTPGPTMKTLQQVEPRRTISQPGSFPVVINASGSYY